MCGIVGYVGAQEAGPILIEGLRRLEYRGYDSAGLAVIGPKGCLRVVKEPGKLAELERVLESGMPSGTCGIAHTRWATHGAPTRANAHPHWSQNGDVALVHNGIIENADALRVRLSEIGYVFETETDTEALVHLIDEAFRDNSTLEDAVLAALDQVEGAYGIAVLSSRDPGKIVAARKGSPLLIGIGKNGENFV
ncbi:MAG: glutamine--fructose-6-phosphate aminotransferase, partial [Gemmatimonadetes bacterium]|nr:glutamine--fructose-6-phosphate aminotransferase [Gemmatimonadota bacterium]